MILNLFLFPSMKMIHSAKIFILFILTSLSLHIQAQDRPPYDLESPKIIYTLPDYLEEVSGLTYFNTNQLAMHNDEKGRMYVFDLKKRAVVQRVRFDGDGDYEGIERVGEYIYIVKSNGNLYRFNVNIEGVVEKIETPFDSKNNVEGLGYNPKTNHLLIALKDDGDTPDVKVAGKAIYGYNLNEKTFDKLPHFSVSHKDMERVLGKDYKFHPSAVAVHPLTEEVYVLSAHKRALMVFGKDGKPKNLTDLKRSLFPQPEGIAFSPEGDLYISNEMEGEGGTLLWFKMKQ